jgi:hypothetical protein
MHPPPHGCAPVGQAGTRAETHWDWKIVSNPAGQQPGPHSYWQKPSPGTRQELPEQDAVGQQEPHRVSPVGHCRRTAAAQERKPVLSAAHELEAGQQVPSLQATGALAGHAGRVATADPVQPPVESQPDPGGQQRTIALASSKCHSARVSAVGASS